MFVNIYILLFDDCGELSRIGGGDTSSIYSSFINYLLTRQFVNILKGSSNWEIDINLSWDA